jgi:hypothetical protein
MANVMMWETDVLRRRDPKVKPENPAPGHIRFKLALTLLMAGVFTDDADDALAADHFALHANFFNGRSDFHDYSSRFWAHLIFTGHFAR